MYQPSAPQLATVQSRPMSPFFTCLPVYGSGSVPAHISATTPPAVLHHSRSCGRFFEPHSYSHSCAVVAVSVSLTAGLHAELCQAPVSLPEACHDQVAGAADHQPPHRPLPCLYRPLVSFTLPACLVLPCLYRRLVSFYTVSLPCPT